MLRRIVILNLVIVSAWLCWPQQSALADDLAQREKVATERTVAVTKVSQLHGRYRFVRDNLVLNGSGGLQGQVSDFFQSMHQWISTWYGVLGEFNGGEDRSWYEIYPVVMEQFRGQQSKLAEMQQQEEQIQGIRSSVFQVMEKAPEVKENELEGNGELIKALNRHVTLLTQNAKAIADLAAKARSKADQLQSVTQYTLVSLYQRFVLRQNLGPLEQLTQRFDDLLVFESTVEPLLKQLATIEQELEGQATRERGPYAVDALWKKGQQKCTSIRSTVQGSAVAEDRRDDALYEVNATCNAMRQHVEFFTSFGNNRAVQLFSFAKAMRTKAAKLCQVATPAINCQKAYTLARVNLEVLQSMTVEQQRFYEEQWHKLLRNEI